MTFGKFFEIYNHSRERGGVNGNARRVREVLTGCVSNDTTQIPLPKERTFRTNKKHIRKTHSVEDTPRGPLFGHSLEKGGMSWLWHTCSGDYELPSSRKVTLYNEPSTKTSKSRRQLTVCFVPLHYNAFLEPQ